MSKQIEQIRAEIKRGNLANYCGTAEQYEEELFAILDTIEAEENEHPIPADVQEAAEKYDEEATKIALRTTSPFQEELTGPAPTYSDAFEAGAEWQRERLASCPTIKGWVARDMKKQALYFYTIRPTRSDYVWTCMVNSCCPIKDKKAFPDLRWEDEPKQVRVIIEEIKEAGK